MRATMPLDEPTDARDARPFRGTLELRCRQCGGPLLAVCMRCRGRVGGRAKTRRKLKAIRENLARARAATAKRRGASATCVR